MIISSTSLKTGLFLAVRQLKRASKGATALIIFVTTLTFLNIVLTNGILVGLAQGSATEYAKQYSGQVLITPLDNKNYIENSQDIIQIAQSTPGVTNYLTRYVHNGTLVADYKRNVKSSDKSNDIDALFAGIDPVGENKQTGLAKLVTKGSYLQPGDEGYILVGSGLLAQYSTGQDPEVITIKNVDVGTKAKIQVNGKEKEEIVKGIITSKIGNVNLRVYFNAPEFRKLIDRNDFNVNEIALHVTPGYNPEHIRTVLRANPVVRTAKVQTAAESQGQFLIDIQQGFTALGAAIGAVALIVASVTIFIVVYINALSRKKYIGILKGIGIDAQTIQFSYTAQAIFYALCGIGIALILVYAVVKPILDRYPIETPLSNGILVADASGVIIRALVLLVISALAGYVPARLIVRKNTLDAILGR